MGYRSEVVLAMKETAFKKMLEGWTDSIAIEVLSYTNKSIRDEWIMINWSDVKWYEGYQDVDAVMNFLQGEDCSQDDFEFHRLGEDQDDYEHDGDIGNSPFNICLHRSLSFDE
jgi:hypothetical protein